MIRLLLLLLYAFFFSLCAFGSDWPQFKRTSNRQGCNLNETVQLPSTLCLWVNFGSPVEASPIIANNKAYAISSQGILACVDLANAAILWHKPLSGIGNVSAPATENDTVWVATQSGMLYVIRGSDGTIINSFNTGSSILADLLLLPTGIYVGAINGIFYAFDRGGNLKWSHQADQAIVHAACEKEGQIVFTDGDQHAIWLADSGASYHEIRNVSIKTLGPSICSFMPPMIWNDTIFFAKGEVELLTDFTGVFKFGFNTGSMIGRITSSISRACLSVDTADGVLFIGSTRNGLFVLGAPRNWNTTDYYSDYPFDGIYGVNSSPAVIGNCVIFGSECGKINFFSKTSSTTFGGTSLWSYMPSSGKAISASPAVSNGRVVIGATDGCLYGFWNGTEVTEPTDISDSTSTRGDVSRIPAPGTWTLFVSPNPSATGNIVIAAQGIETGYAIVLYDVQGRIIKEWRNNGPKMQRIVWNRSDAAGHTVPSGTYFAVMKNRSGMKVQKFKIVIM